MNPIQKISFPNFEWTHIAEPTEQNIRDLAKKYDFHPLDVADCLKQNHRAKIDTYQKYTFLVFLFPIYDRQTREITASEVDVFIGKNFFITISQTEFPIVNDFFNTFILSEETRQNFTDKSPEQLLYRLLEKVFNYCFPMIEHLSQDCDTIEKAIFSGKEREMVYEILITKRNIIDFRKTMQVYRNLLKKLIFNLKESPQFMMKKTDVYFESLRDYTKEIWETLENLKERIDALHQTNESRISFKLSDIMRILTVISVITFPVTLLATVFGMNAIESMPLIENPYGFWYIIGLMVIIITIMIAFFKKKGWM
jgi:magnesium transporter